MNKQQEFTHPASSTPEFDDELHNLRLERDNAIIFLSTVQNSLAEHSQQLRVAQRTMETKDTYIASLQSEQQNLWDRVEEKDAYIASLEEEVSTLRGLIEQKDTYALSLEEERSKLTGAIAVKDTYVASLLEEHRKLRDLIEEKDRYIRSLQAAFALK